MNEILKTTYATWDKDSERSAVPKDARSWTKEHVRLWLSWAMREFSFEGVNFSQFVQQFQVCIHNYNTQARLRQAAGQSATINHVRFLYICRALGHLS